MEDIRITVDLNFDGEKKGVHLHSQPEMAEEDVISFLLLTVYNKALKANPEMSRKEVSEWVAGLVETVCFSEDLADMEDTKWKRKN